MKKIFIPFVIAATTLSFAACQKEVSSPAIEDELVSLNFTSANPTTKTVADAVNKTILWEKGDKISIAYTVNDNWQNATGDATKDRPAKIYASNGLAAGGETAVFNISGDFNATATGVHQFYSVYPSSCVKSTEIKYAPSVTMSIPDVQTPAENSFDAAADLMIGKATKTYNSLSEAKADEIPLLWQRIVSHADITLKGLQGLTENEVITTIVLTADADAKLVGDRWIDIQNGNILGPKTITDANILTINGTNLKVNSNNVEFWAAVMPATVKSLNIVVETNKATYTRNIESCNIVFKQNARKGLNVDMSSVERVEKEETPDYSGEWLIVDNDMKYACKNYSSGKFYSNYELTTSNGSICETLELPNCKMVLTKVTNNGAKQGLYTIQDSKGLYIKCSGKTSISGVSTLDDECYWKITYDEKNTLWKIASSSTTPYYLLYNTASPRFTTYEKTSQSVIDIKLISYKDVLPLTEPVLSADKAITVPAVGIENGSMSITVKNIKTVNTSVDGTVVTSASVSGDILTYTVSKNETTDIRKGFITLSAEGVDNVTIEVTQNGDGGAAAKTYTLQFGNGYGDDGTNTYTKTWTATRDGFTWNMVNWNNNNYNNDWTYVKAGPKGNTNAHAMIQTNAAMPEAISKITITIDKIENGTIKSIVLKSSPTNDFSSGTTIETKSSVTTTENTAIDVVFTIPLPQNNLYYQLDFNLNNTTPTGKKGKNGVATVSKVVYTNN